nr:flavin reductase [Clostridium sp.]
MENNYTFELEKAIDNLENTGAFLTSGNQSKANTMTISWGSIGYMWRKPIFVILISDIRYTKEFIDIENTFTVSIPYNKNKAAALDICGHNSGRNINKEEAANIKFIPSKIVSSPIVEGCNRYYECKVVFKQTVDSSKIDKETHYKDEEVEHTLYFGEIVAQYSSYVLPQIK